MTHNKQMGIIKPIDAGVADDHKHDDRYYTESEIKGMLSNKSNLGHTHDEYSPLDHDHDEYSVEGHTHDGYVTKAQHNALVDDIQQILTFISGMVPAGTIMWFKSNPDSRYWSLYTPLVGRYPLGTADTAEAGTTVAAGLPNIAGTFSGVGHSESDNTTMQNTLTGAFYVAGKDNGVRITNDTTATRDDTFGFDASKSNIIYGRSTTVTPPSAKLLPFMRNGASPQLSLSSTI